MVAYWTIARDLNPASGTEEDLVLNPVFFGANGTLLAHHGGWNFLVDTIY